MSAPLPINAQDVLDFWFGRVEDSAHASYRAWWFRKSAAVDARIVQRFGLSIERALSGELVDWADSPPGALAHC